MAWKPPDDDLTVNNLFDGDLWDALSEHAGGVEPLAVVEVAITRQNGDYHKVTWRAEGA